MDHLYPVLYSYYLYFIPVLVCTINGLIFCVFRSRNGFSFAYLYMEHGTVRYECIVCEICMHDESNLQQSFYQYLYSTVQ